MNTKQSDHELEPYQLVLVSPKENVALLEESEGAVRLPRVAISRHTRPAEQITSVVLDTWGLPTVVIDWLCGHHGEPDCAVVEVLAPGLPQVEGLTTASIAQIPNDALPPESMSTLGGILQGISEDIAPFSRFGWVDEVEEWIRDCAGDKSLRFGRIRQLNAGGPFALARFSNASDGTAYWVKAVGHPNTREFCTTSYLAERCTEYLPTIVGMREGWNAWIMEESGASLHSSPSLAEFELAVARLAGLQKRLAGKAAELIAARFIDHRICILKSHIDQLIDYLEEAMRRQISSRVPSLSTTRLREIGVLLHESCDAMSDLGIPDSVMHGDISPGSILRDDARGLVFTDWCEAYVGNPFITFEQLSVHAMRKTSTPNEWRTSLTDIYRSSWLDSLKQKQIESALKLASLLSVLSYLYGRGEWLHSSRRNDPEFQSYTRSLARHMDRIAKDSFPSEALCQFP